MRIAIRHAAYILDIIQLGSLNGMFKCFARCSFRVRETPTHKSFPSVGLQDRLLVVRFAGLRLCRLDWQPQALKHQF